MRRVCLSMAVLLGVTLSAAGTRAAETPDMTHVWRLMKTSWTGACSGKPTHFMTVSQSECNAAKGIGYQGNCTTGNYDAEHYASAVSFPNSVPVYRLSKGGTCGCKDTFIYTPSDYWKSYFQGQGYNVESGKEYYVWPASIGPLNTANGWGLVPVYHAYSNAMCDNFYTEHPDQYNTKLGSGYTGGFETDPAYIAYYAADGWIDLQVQCSVPGCSWKLTGPGGWSVSKTGSYSFPSQTLPSHGYLLQCNPVSGMVTKAASQSLTFTFFTSNTAKCEYTCDNQCSFANQKECVGSSYRVCQADGNGCLKWGSLVSCDDGNSCTQGDGCQGGACVVGTPMNCSYLSDTCNNGVCSGGQCVAQPKSGACNDNDACTTNDSCQGGSCIGTPKDCSYLNDSCNQGVCQGGTCVAQPKGGACSDGNSCTEGDFCQNGKCQPGGPKDCSYLTDSCNTGICSGGQCVAQAKSGACEDGNPCTIGDVCAGGKCTSGGDKDCSAWTDPCNQGVCSGGNCLKQPKSGNCSDGDPCTSGDACAGGACVGTPMDCSAFSDACNEGVCAEGKCLAQAKPGPCSDGEACTEGDACSGGKCIPGKWKDCSYLTDPCNSGVCVDGACQAKAKDGPCEDGDLCTTGDFCSQGKCSSGAPVDCTPLDDSCQTGVCVGGLCKAEPKPGMECDDGVDCTQDKCDPALGCLNSADVALCDDANPCTEDLCLPLAGGCFNSPVAAPCEDGDLCSVGDACIDGNCQPGTPKDCADWNVCTDDSCIPATGDCLHAPNTAPCDDASDCTTGDVCFEKACAGLPVNCDDGIDCTTDLCQAGQGCTHEPDDSVCEDGDPCTDGKCSPLLGCQQEPNQAVCSDGNPCTEEDSCAEGICTAGSPKDCDDQNPCTKDFCLPETGACVQEAIAAACDDGDACTDGDSCVEGTCTGAPVDGCCKSDGDCLNEKPECQLVTCTGGVCKPEAYCAQGRCGPNACDATVDCGKCLPIEVCVMDGWCKQKCNPADKNMTRCTDDGQSVEKCVFDEVSGEYFWQATDCVAIGHAGCAFSKDKGIFICCTPDCADKECGLPSACGMSCGSCPGGDYCCLPGEPCVDSAPDGAFSCVDCCLGLECGPSLAEGCDQTCGVCPDSFVCKEGKCVSGCKDANVDAVGVCAGPVAWWCETSLGKETLQSVDCSKFVATCCMDETQGKVGCCTCEKECAEKGWECGLNTCGEKCGQFDGGCGPGFSCVPETHQCLCHTPELCYPEDEPDGEPDVAAGDTGGSLVVPDEGGSGTGTDGGRKSGGCQASATAAGEAGYAALLLVLALLSLRRVRRARFDRAR